MELNNINLSGKHIETNFMMSPKQRQIDNVRSNNNSTPGHIAISNFSKRKSTQVQISSPTSVTNTNTRSYERGSRMNVTGQNFAGMPSLKGYTNGEIQTSHGMRPINQRASQIAQLRNSTSQGIKNSNPFSQTTKNFGAEGTQMKQNIRGGRHSNSGLQFQMNPKGTSITNSSMVHMAGHRALSRQSLGVSKDQGMMTTDRIHEAQRSTFSQQSPRIKAISSALEKHAISVFLNDNQIKGKTLTNQQIEMFKKQMQLREMSTNLTSPKSEFRTNTFFSQPQSPTSQHPDQNPIDMLGDHASPESSVSCQQSIIRQLKDQQRAKQVSQLNQHQGLSLNNKDFKNIMDKSVAEMLISTPAERNSKMLMVENIQNKPNVTTGHQYPRINEVNPRPARDAIMGSYNTDFGVSYKEISEAGKILSEGQESLMKKKAGKNFDVNVLETWINETLREAEYFGIPGVLKRDRIGEGSGAGGRQSKSMEYGIDRLTLNNTGISNESIDKLYRSFYITSVGLFTQMKNLINQQSDSLKLKRSVCLSPKDNKVTDRSSGFSARGQDTQKQHLTKASLLSSLWRVYTVLLEYTYSQDYKLQIQVIQEHNEKKQKAQTDKISEILISQEDKNRNFREQVKELTDELKTTQEKLRYAQNEMRKTEFEMQKSQNSHEEEVMMRMKFEEKMNHLHSLNRTFQDSSIHYKKILIDKEAEVLYLREALEESQQKLKTESTEKESAIQWKTVAEKKMNLVEYELKEYKDLFNIQKVNLDRETLSNSDYLKKIRDQENTLIEDKDKINNCLQSMSSQKLVEQNLRRINEQKVEQISEINKVVAKQVEKIAGLEVYIVKADITIGRIEVNIIKADSKIETLEKKMQEKRAKIKYLENDTRFFESQFTFTKEQIQRNELVFYDQCNKIQDLNEERLQHLEQIKQLKKNIDILDAKIIDLTSIESSLKEQNQRLESDKQSISEICNEAKKLSNSRRLELDGLKKSSSDKIAFLEKKVDSLENKQGKLQDSLQVEEKKCQSQHEQLQANRQMISQQYNKVSLLECDVQTKTEELDQIQTFNDRLVDLNNQYLTSSEKMKKNLATADQTNKYFESEKKKEIKRISDEFETFKAKVEKEQFFVEDIMSQHMRLLDQSTKQKENKKYMDFKINEQATQLHRQGQENAALVSEAKKEIALKLEFTVKYQLAHKEKEALKIKLTDAEGFSAGQKAQIKNFVDDVASLELKNMRMTKALDLVTKELQKIKSIVQVQQSTQMEVQYYPFNKSFTQINSIEKVRLETQVQSKLEEKEREFMQREDKTMKMLYNKDKGLSLPSSENPITTQRSDNDESKVSKQIDGGLQETAGGTIERLSTNQAKSRLNSQASNEKSLQKSKTSLVNIQEGEGLPVETEILPECESKIEEGQEKSFEASLKDEDEGSNKSKNDKPKHRCMVKYDSVDSNTYKAKLFPQDLTDINPNLHKLIHITEGKAHLMNIQLKQFSYWDKFIDNETQCTLQKEMDEMKALEEKLEKERVDKIQELQKTSRSRNSVQKQSLKTGPTISVGAKNSSNVSVHDDDGLDAFQSQAEYDDYGALKPKISNYNDRKKSGCECDCHNYNSPFTGSEGSNSRDNLNQSSLIKKREKSIKKQMADKIKKLQQGALSAGMNSYNTDQDETEKGMRSTSPKSPKSKKGKWKKAKNVIMATQEFAKGKNATENFSDSNDYSKQTTVINVKTTGNTNQVFEVHNTEVGEEAGESGTRRSPRQSPKVTSSTQAGRFGKPNIRKLIKGSYTRN